MGNLVSLFCRDFRIFPEDGTLAINQVYWLLAVVDRPEPLRPSKATISPAGRQSAMQHLALAMVSMRVSLSA
jgi:hypothetical protein